MSERHFYHRHFTYANRHLVKSCVLVRPRKEECCEAQRKGSNLSKYRQAGD